MTTKFRIILADDHAVVRGGTKLIINNEPDMQVVGEAGDGEELLQMIAHLDFDIALVDINMPRLNGIKAGQQIKQIKPTAKVLMLTGYNNESYVQSSIDSGIDGFLLKDRSISELLTGIRMVGMGNQVFPKLTSWVGHNTRPTERDLKIIKLVAEGLSNKEIARKLHITERTVEYHLGNLYNKLLVSSRVEAVKKANDLGWLLDA